jgi:hypothetical protein
MLRDIIEGVESVLVVCDGNTFGAFSPESFSVFQLKAQTHGGAVGV